jgi:peptidyl-prolyl cis-trans isomerase-like 4
MKKIFLRLQSALQFQAFTMSVLLETTFGDIIIDLFTEECPNTTKNFLKLCKIKYYNNCLFHNIQKDYLIQTGDPTNTGKGGESIYG